MSTAIHSHDLADWHLWPLETDRGRFFYFWRRHLDSKDYWELKDYHEFMDLLEKRFSAVRSRQLDGPYSTHVLVTVRNTPLIVILDSEDIILRAENRGDDFFAEHLAGEILDALNKKRTS